MYLFNRYSLISRFSCKNVSLLLERRHLSVWSNVNFGEQEIEKQTKKKKSGQSSWIIKPDVVDSIFSNLKKDLKPNDLVIEFDPGKGLLTQRLMELENELILFNCSDALVKNMTDLHLDKSKNVTFSQYDFKLFHKYFWETKKFTSVKYQDVIEMIRSKSSPERDIKVVGVAITPNFFFTLLFCFAIQSGIFEAHFNPEFYLCIPHKIYSAMHHEGLYAVSWRLGLLLNIYFKKELLAKMHKSSFHTKYKFRKEKKKGVQSENFYLFKFTPNPVQFEQNTTKERLIFHFFVNYLIRCGRHCNIITALEGFIPNCGEDFIKQGFHVFDHPYYMSRTDWLRAFDVFKSLPSFKVSHFEEEFHHYYREFSHELKMDEFDEETVVEDFSIEEPDFETDLEGFGKDNLL